jgi:hypothetical protein
MGKQGFRRSGGQEVRRSGGQEVRRCQKVKKTVVLRRQSYTSLFLLFFLLLFLQKSRTSPTVSITHYNKL